jgi:riboflavin transporter FmnP
MNTPPSPLPNTLGKASLVLGILGSFFVFTVGLCAGVGHAQGWLKHVGALFFVLGGSAAFLGALAVVLGFFGLWGRNRSRVTAIVGLLLGAFAVWLFLVVVQAAQRP